MVVEIGTDSTYELELSDTCRVKEDPIQEQTLTTTWSFPISMIDFIVARLDVQTIGK